MNGALCGSRPERIGLALRCRRRLTLLARRGNSKHCLAYEIARRGLSVQRQVALPLVYEGEKLDAGDRLDLVIDSAVIIEVKAIDALAAIHDAQVLTYLKLSGLRIGLLMNFNVALLKQGLKRFVV